jgi:hypothetical protein
MLLNSYSFLVVQRGCFEQALDLQPELMSWGRAAVSSGDNHAG